jgi:hypothetical protein
MELQDELESCLLRQKSKIVAGIARELPDQRLEDL